MLRDYWTFVRQHIKRFLLLPGGVSVILVLIIWFLPQVTAKSLEEYYVAAVILTVLIPIAAVVIDLLTFRLLTTTDLLCDTAARITESTPADLRDLLLNCRQADQDLTTLRQGCTQHCSEISTSLNDIVAHLSSGIATTKANLDLYALLCALSQTIRHPERLQRLCSTPVVQPILDEKLALVNTDISSLSRSRICFPSLEDFLRIVEAKWDNISKSVTLQRKDRISFLSLEWLPPGGVFGNLDYERIYYDTIIHPFIPTHRISLRRFLGTSRYTQISADDAHFLEEQRIRHDLVALPYMAMKAVHPLLQPSADQFYNCLIAFKRTNESNASPLFVMRTAILPVRGAPSAVLTVDEEDLKHAMSVLAFCDDEENDKETLEYNYHALSKGELEEILVRSPDGAVFERINQQLGKANEFVVATDVAGCVPDNGIERWEKSSLYRRIARTTEQRAQYLFQIHGNNLGRRRGFVRIYIVAVDTADRRAAVRRRLGEVIESRHLQTYVIDVNAAASLFPKSEVTDFHVVDGQMVACLDVGPGRPYSKSELFGLKPAERTRLMEEKNKQEREVWIDQFFTGDAQELLAVFDSLLKSKATQELQSKKDLNDWLQKYEP